MDASSMNLSGNKSVLAIVLVAIVPSVLLSAALAYWVSQF